MTMMPSRPVTARASRTAAFVASLPFLANRTISAPGTSAHSRSASAYSSRVGNENETPSCSCWATAKSTAGCRCPRMTAPIALT